MAQNFLQWLESCYFQLAPYKETRITVISVIGKETADNLKPSTINQLLLNQNSAFGCGTWSMQDGSPISIDAFFTPESSILYLLVNGINDCQAQSYLFGSGRFREKSFFEKMAIVEMEFIHLLHLVFIISHLIVFIEQSCRFDTEWIRTLKAVKTLRVKTERIVKSALAKECPGCPKSWLEEGRLAVPKMIFAFHRSPLRADLGAAKRKELLEKLEKSLEGQLVSLLKHHKIVEKHSRVVMENLRRDVIRRSNLTSKPRHSIENFLFDDYMGNDLFGRNIGRNPRIHNSRYAQDSMEEDGFLTDPEDGFGQDRRRGSYPGSRRARVQYKYIRVPVYLQEPRKPRSSSLVDRRSNQSRQTIRRSNSFKHLTRPNFLPNRQSIKVGYRNSGKEFVRNARRSNRGVGNAAREGKWRHDKFKGEIQKQRMTAEELDKELEAYMKISKHPRVEEI